MTNNEIICKADQAPYDFTFKLECTPRQKSTIVNRLTNGIVRTVRSWFTDSAGDGQDKTGEDVEKLRQRVDDMEKIVCQYENENYNLRHKVEKLRQLTNDMEKTARQYDGENKALRRQVEELQAALSAKLEIA